MRSPGLVRFAGWEGALAWLAALWVGHRDCRLVWFLGHLGWRRNARFGQRRLFVVGILSLQLSVPAAAALEVGSVIRVHHMLSGVSSHLALEFLAAAASSLSAAAAAAADECSVQRHNARCQRPGPVL